MQPFCNPFRASTDQLPIVMVTHEYAPFRGGVAVFVREIAAAAQASGFGVEVWTVDYGRRLAAPAGYVDAATYSPPPVPVVRLPANGRLTPVGLAAFAWGLLRRRERLRAGPVILLSVGAQMVFLVFAALRILPADRVTVLFHGSELLRFGRSWFWRGLARRFYAQTAGFGVLTGAIERLARTSGLLPPEARIVVVPGALPSAFVAAGTSLVPVADPRDEAARVLTVARLHPRKGQLEVAHALGRLSAGQRARLIYQMVGVGASSYQREVARACREGGVRCEFLGALDDVALAGVYRRATVYAQASLTLPESVEGFGLSFLEASFHGCPVAAYRSGGVEEAVIDGQSGLLVPEGDRAGLATAIARLLDEPALRMRLGEAGRKFARGFSWEKSARTLCEAALPSQVPSCLPPPT